MTLFSRENKVRKRVEIVLNYSLYWSLRHSPHVLLNNLYADIVREKEQLEIARRNKNFKVKLLVHTKHHLEALLYIFILNATGNI